MQNPHQDWQQALANAITNPQELCEVLALENDEFHKRVSPSTQFSLRVPRGFVARMEKGNWHDPLLLQVLPLAKELETTQGFCQDPLQEKQANPVPGLLHKYHGRVLLIAASGCAIHCRYCFRRYFPYEDNTPGQSGWQPVLEYIAKDETISEVILSGGDPLILKDTSLNFLITKLAAINHVRILRFHTRLPVVLPERITPALIHALTASRLQPVVVIHCNHPREIDQNVQRALSALHNAGITLLNQFVLLRGINDNPDVLAGLSQQLFSCGVLPYYLHLLDPVQGAEHFAVSAEEGRHLIQQITARLPGYLVPKLVCELPGEAAKSPVPQTSPCPKGDNPDSIQ
jgi:L-lysine 2,3-aminomutase